MKIGIHEIGVIERFSSVISVLDGSLEVREDDDFLDWLNCQESQNLAPGHGNTRDADSEGRSGKGDADGGRGGNEARGARKERENVTKLLSNAAARLNELVALREDSLFRDRGELSVATEKQGEGAESEGRGDEAESASTSAVPEELLYQVIFAAVLMSFECSLTYGWNKRVFVILTRVVILSSNSISQPRANCMSETRCWVTGDQQSVEPSGAIRGVCFEACGQSALVHGSQ